MPCCSLFERIRIEGWNSQRCAEVCALPFCCAVLFIALFSFSLISSKIEKQVRAYILDNFCGEQPAGCAFILPLDPKSKDSKAPFSTLCWVAVSRSVDTLNKDFAYLAAWSALTTVRAHNRKIKERKKRLNVVAIPSVSFKSDSVQDPCRQIAVAIKRFLEPPMEPLDKDEAARYEENVIKPATMTAEERSKELEGLLWSRELGSMIRFGAFRGWRLVPVPLDRDQRHLQ